MVDRAARSRWGSGENSSDLSAVPKGLKRAQDLNKPKCVIAAHMVKCSAWRQLVNSDAEPGRDTPVTDLYNADGNRVV